MKKIVISYFKKGENYNAYFLDTEIDNGIQFLKENLTIEEMLSYSELLIQENNMNDDDKVRIDCYDKYGHWNDTTNFKVHEFLKEFYN